jgi:hypothetical protein
MEDPNFRNDSAPHIKKLIARHEYLKAMN